MIVDRSIYIDQLLRSKENGLIKIVTGIRRSGKSFLLKTLFRQKLLESGVQDNHILIIDLESRKFKAFKQEQEKRSLKQISDSFQKIIIVGEHTKPWTNEDGIRTISIYDFLLNDEW